MCIQHKLEALPDATKLALRDISLTFPVGLAEICRQSLQVLNGRLRERDAEVMSKKSSQRENTAYINVMSLLITAREPLPITAFGFSNNEVGCCKFKPRAGSTVVKV